MQYVSEYSPLIPQKVEKQTNAMVIAARFACWTEKLLQCGHFDAPVGSDVDFLVHRRGLDRASTSVCAICGKATLIPAPCRGTGRASPGVAYKPRSTRLFSASVRVRLQKNKKAPFGAFVFIARFAAVTF
jgi:hypothetical protein